MPPVATSRDVPVEPAVDAPHPAARLDARVPATSPGHVLALVRAAVPPLHPGGRPVVAGVAAVAGLTRLATGRGALVGALTTAAVAAFFRNPRRVPPTRTGVALAPAAGPVALVSEASVEVSVAVSGSAGRAAGADRPGSVARLDTHRG